MTSGTLHAWQRAIVAVLVSAAVAACSPPEEPLPFSEPASPTETAPSRAPSADAPTALVDDCVDVVPVGAMLGNPLLVAMWDDAQHDLDILRQNCEALGRTDPSALQSLSDIWWNDIRPQVCHPSYDPCLSKDDDVDCAGGDGDGPLFSVGPIYLIGESDPYELDRDGNRLGCEREL